MFKIFFSPSFSLFLCRKLPLLDIFLELNNRVYEWNRINPAEQYLLLLKHTLRKKLFLTDK